MLEHQGTVRKPLYQCKVCQAPASHSNYGAITCAPCKMFFKRNAQLHQNRFQCIFDGQCEIGVFSRHLCPACRLQKCFRTGMQVELIRGPMLKKNIRRNKPSIHTHQTSTVINLLQTTPPIFFSPTQISSSNDQHHHHQALLLTQRYLFHQSILPLKCRFKLSSLPPFLSSLFLELAPAFLNNEHFHSLPLTDHQLKYVLIFASSMILQQAHLLEDTAFGRSVETLLGRRIFHSNALFHSNSVYTKLSLRVICFGLFDHGKIEGRESVMRMENVYVELLWKYLFSVYEEREGVKYVLNLVGYVLRMMDDVRVVEEEQPVLMDMVNDVLKETVESLRENER